MKITRFVRKLLFPLSIVYGGVMAVRNLLFRCHILKAHTFEIPIISVGNISVGGTGKTPHIEYLIHLFEKNKKVAVLSRGYKRKTTGFRVVNKHDSGSEAGDEPLQIKQKFPSVLVAVDEKRAHGISQLLALQNPPEIILLDDAFQHRWVKPGFQILLDNFNHPIHKDMVLPAGNLREFSCGKKRADLVIVTKCDKITEAEIQILKGKYKHTHPNSLFFSKFTYAKPKPVFDGCSLHIEDHKLIRASVLLVTGIANPKPFEGFVRDKCAEVELLIFSDHHDFTENDIAKIIDKYSNLPTGNKYLITTEKDAMRLREHEKLENILKDNSFYIPIKVQVLFNQEAQLKNILLDYVQEI